MTIKTQNGKVITKDGKVSCECCDECCMYPAQALGDGLYTNDDLPDVVVINELNYSKLNTPEQILGENSTIYYKNSTENIIALTESFSNFIWEWLEGLSGGGGVCLIDGYDESGSIGERLLTFDQFADTYTISGPISGTVTRESICVWRGEGLRLTNFGFQWKVNGNNKSGFQNTPVGSYAGGYSVS